MEASQMDHLCESFHTQGFAILKDVIESSVLQEVKSGIDQIVDTYAEKLVSRHAVPHVFRQAPFEKRLMLLFENNMDEAPALFRAELHRRQFYGLFFHERVLDAVEALIGPEILLYPNYSVRPKLPDLEAARVLWHQDGGYTEPGRASDDVASLRMVNVWCPLVPARVRNGCMQFVPGTHKLGVVPHEKKRYYLEIANEYLQPRLPDAVNIELDPGDVALFHNLLFHQGLPNHSEEIRWSLDWRYLDAMQPTLRKEKGHLARSVSRPGQVVASGEEWAKLKFG